METNYQKFGLINLLALASAGGVAFLAARMSGSAAGMVASAFLGFGALTALVGWFQMHLQQREQLEQLEVEELTRTGRDAALFASSAAELLPARRAREQFDRFFVPAFSVLLAGLQGAAAFFLWKRLAQAASTPLVQPVLALAAFAFLALVLFLFGKFSSGLVRIEKVRLLRPSATSLLLSAYLLAAAVAGLVLVQAEFPNADLWVARGMVILLGLLAAELLVQLVLEIYRPRVRGQPGRLMYDSRIAGLLGQPEGLFTTAAHALDYQFGFKVSETWFYRFLERSLAWLLLLQLALLWLFTSVVIIDIGEAAVLERFGRPVAGRPVLEPGAHLKFPWPIDRAHRYQTDQIQTFNIGFVSEEKKESVIQWSEAHYTREFDLLVATREEPIPGGGERKAPPVNLLTVSIPVQFQITNLQSWIYNHTAPASMLEKSATREVVRYLVSADMHELMSSGRQAASQALQERIQAAASELGLGVRIVFVGLQDIHPPQAVAGKYEEVIGAAQKKIATVLSAEAFRDQTNRVVQAEKERRIAASESEKDRRIRMAEAQASQFRQQAQAYRVAPEVFRHWATLEAYSQGPALARKFVVAAEGDEVFNLQLEEKFNPLARPFELPPNRSAE